MTLSDIIRFRLYNQQLSCHQFKDPASLVSWMGAIQAQDFAGGKWAIGLRLGNITDADIELAIAKKSIVRSWPMRGTIHFISPEDLRWMLKLLAPRVIARAAGIYRQAGLDSKIFNKSEKIFAKILKDQRLTRDEIYNALKKSKINTDNQRGLHILGYHAQRGLICLATRKGRQHTFTLLDDWLPPGNHFDRDESICELTRRYFISHGPATLQDFAWWSGLTVADAKRGIEMAAPMLRSEKVNNNNYLMNVDLPVIKDKSRPFFLLPNYDEYLVAYKDRSIAVDAKLLKTNQMTGNGILAPVMVTNGKVAGTWKRSFKKDQLIIELTAFSPLSKSHKAALTLAARKYSKFMERRELDLRF